MKECEICKQASAFTTSIKIDGDGPDEFWTVHICVRCWDAVATIACEALEKKFADMQSQIDTLSQVIECIYFR